MHNIGNDIVDLNLARTESNWLRKGFLEKQFTQNEQEEIHDAENPFFKVWQFWSMKEAAYKCYTQKIEKRFFAPQKFECSLVSKTEGFVLFEENKYCTSTSYNPLYIHTIAKEESSKVAIFLKIGASKNIYIDLKTQLSIETGVLSDEIVKVKTIIGAPLFYHKEKLLTKSCSISHHGNYGAFVFSLEK
ncbi:hypothetical protein BTO15_05780 [Polaribacter sejongensis]|uniref:4'-phosphopantetheinyl transferase domain-containing protein n=1 Tax=Polaribacter sejongensis TaxID=985043 RepID=A0ABN5F5X0_9FLAO|nr:4'-phosphopantetheinyl transferase superfamily protein [Polaribacter sejongensis]AUC21642.1 hypothetical protein BTO15_05780 [Polaribacter sejongensis]